MDISKLKLGACADKLWELRAERAELMRKVGELEKLESALRERIINELPKSEAGGVAGKKARVQITSKRVPTVEDWEKVQDYVKKNAGKGGFALLQRRINAAAVQELWDAGKQVPGVTVFNAVGLSVTKL